VAHGLLIVNPYASRVTMERVAKVKDALPGEVEVRLTERRGHATELAREAAAAGDVDALYVFSGDGGFNEVLNGVDGTIPIGFLPGGNTNVLSRALGLPRDPLRAAQQLAAGRTRRISVGRVNGRRFGFSAGIGFDAELVRGVDALGRRSDGKRPGDLAFGWVTARTLARHRGRYQPVLDLDGLGRAALVLVANCNPYSYAGPVPLRIAPEAQFELGLDVVAPTQVRPIDLPRLVRYMVRGKGQHDAQDVIYVHDADRLGVRCDRPLPLQVDGEDLGDVDEAVFECEREALSVLV
jgi:diacylglycerol kinase family enzyme